MGKVNGEPKTTTSKVYHNTITGRSKSKDMLERINSFYDASEATPQIKVVVIGESGAGKSNLISRLVEDRFDPRSKSTIGIDFSRYVYRPSGEVDDGGQSYLSQIWDPAGQER